VYDNAASLDSGTDIVVGAMAIGFQRQCLADASLQHLRHRHRTRWHDAPDLPSGGSFQWDGADWISIQTAYTDSEGAYVLDGLASGTYRVWFHGDDNLYGPEAYDNAATLDAGTNLVLAWPPV
jgi:hypothetical protein